MGKRRERGEGEGEGMRAGTLANLLLRNQGGLLLAC